MTRPRPHAGSASSSAPADCSATSCDRTPISWLGCRTPISWPPGHATTSSASATTAIGWREGGGRAAARGGRRRDDHDARRGIHGRHHVAANGRCERLGRVDHAERRLGAGVHRGPHRRRALAANAGVRDGRNAESVQRARAGQTPARHVEPEYRAARRQTVPVVRRAGRRRAGSESAAVLPERGRVPHERAAGRRGREHQQLPDA